ncbi:hypothetical protein POG20_18485, partial [Blautia wexlerae]|nr:hypothetical protein [Blautia wexlerae]
VNLIISYTTVKKNLSLPFHAVETVRFPSLSKRKDSGYRFLQVKKSHSATPLHRLCFSFSKRNLFLCAVIFFNNGTRIGTQAIRKNLLMIL